MRHVKVIMFEKNLILKFKDKNFPLTDWYLYSRYVQQQQYNTSFFYRIFSIIWIAIQILNIFVCTDNLNKLEWRQYLPPIKLILICVFLTKYFVSIQILNNRFWWVHNRVVHVHMGKDESQLRQVYRSVLGSLCPKNNTFCFTFSKWFRRGVNNNRKSCPTYLPWIVICTWVYLSKCNYECKYSLYHHWVLLLTPWIWKSLNEKMWFFHCYYT